MTDRERDCTDSSCETLVSPIPRVRARPLAVQRRPARRKVTFVDSGKPSSDRILALARRALEERGVEVGAPLRKLRASRLPPTSIVNLRPHDGGRTLGAPWIRSSSSSD